MTLSVVARAPRWKKELLDAMSIRTLVVDDTVIYRKILSQAVGQFAELELVGAAASGSIALHKLGAMSAELVLLDVHMPEMDGLETLRRIRERFPHVMVIMVSGISTRSTRSTIQALELGAVDFIRKPESTNPAESMSRLIADLKPVIRLVQTRLFARGQAATLPRGPAVHRQAPAVVRPAHYNTAVPPRFSVCAIGVSTGGPEALAKLLPAIPADLSTPIVLVQHMPPNFTRSLAESLDRKSAIRVKEGEDGEAALAGCVYIAPGGRHMTVRRTGEGVVLGLNDGPPENSCRPSVDVLFRSVAAAYGDRGVLAAVLTGMGNDGLAGMRTLKRLPCLCITQSAESCVVYGMPRAIDEAGLADLSLPIERIGDEITSRIRGRSHQVVP